MNILKKAILNYLVKHLFKGFTSEDIIRYDSKAKQFFLGGRLMTEKELDSIVKTLKLLDLNDGYKYLLREVEYLAEEKLFVFSKTEDDMIFSKVALFIVDILRKRKSQIITNYEDYKTWQKSKNIQ